MKHCGRMLMCVLVGVAVNAGAIVSVSDAKGSPYRTIERRNLFGLVPLVNSRTEAPAPIIPRPKVTLAGIAALLGYKTAFLMLPAAKAGGVRECLLLREGETQEEIQVRQIGDKTVRVVNHGEEQILSFDNNPSQSAGVPVPIDSPVDRISPMPPPEKPLTHEQQLLLIEAQRLKAMQDGDPVAKILPPTEMTAEITDGTP
ncbi:MAG TPA: hypothetical protein VKV04_02775 [Verrucomicrobiae bacterium]|nr:hypothetical protein [Verrucomicrobiae bacterium]